MKPFNQIVYKSVKIVFIMSKRIVLSLIMVFAILGIFIAGTLTLAKYSDSIAILCGEDVDNSCNTVQNSEYSYLINVESDSGSNFQVPISLAGVVFYTLLLVLSVILYKRDSVGLDLGNLKYYLFGFGFVGILFSAVYTWLQVYKIDAFCTYCLISAFDSAVLFVLVYLLAFRKDEVKNAIKNSNSRKTKK
jgi:uncharacterized membrane protein